MAKQDLSESMEDYLETILLLQEENLVARAKDIAERLGVKTPSVSSALKKLHEKDLINYDPYSYVTLTSAGKTYARAIHRRHEILTRFLTTTLGVVEETADSNACRLEHVLDKDVIERISDFLDFIMEHGQTCLDLEKFKNDHSPSKD